MLPLIPLLYCGMTREASFVNWLLRDCGGNLSGVGNVVCGGGRCVGLWMNGEQPAGCDRIRLCLWLDQKSVLVDPSSHTGHILLMCCFSWFIRYIVSISTLSWAWLSSILSLKARIWRSLAGGDDENPVDDDTLMGLTFYGRSCLPENIGHGVP